MFYALLLLNLLYVICVFNFFHFSFIHFVTFVLKDTISITFHFTTENLCSISIVYTEYLKNKNLLFELKLYCLVSAGYHRVNVGYLPEGYVRVTAFSSWC